ncbi:hypothetical protein CRYUN_Cryun35bG0085400 [Craigia yunnanensis]
MFSFSGSNGAPGGILSTWEENFFFMESSLTTFRFVLIQGVVKPLNLRCVVNIYASNEASERARLCKELLELKEVSTLPWCIGGDFNIIKEINENIGVSIDFNATRDFASFIEDASLIDLPLLGTRFTWAIYGEVPSMSRLDRFLISREWLEKAPLIKQWCLPRSISNHNAICLSTEDYNWGLKPFHFFNYWLEDSKFSDIVSKSWQVNINVKMSGFKFWKKLATLKVGCRGMVVTLVVRFQNWSLTSTIWRRS